MHPVLIHIGPFTIRWYGVMIALACFIGLSIAKKEAQRKEIGEENIDTFFLYTIVGAVIGARLYYIAFSNPSLFWRDPFAVFAIWEGGLAIHGAVLSGIIIAIIYAKFKRISFLKFSDTLVPSLILGQAIGRIGCFLNGDAHGFPTDLPWGMVFASNSPAGQMFPGQPLHPTQLYEMILNSIIFIILWNIRKRINIDGYMFFLYVILYSAVRIFVEHFRADKLTYFSNISAAQTIGVIGIVLGSIALITLKSKTHYQKNKNLRRPVILPQ